MFVLLDSRDLDWEEPSRKYDCHLNRRVLPSSPAFAALHVSVIESAEDPRLTTNVIDCNAAGVRVANGC